MASYVDRFLLCFASSYITTFFLHFIYQTNRPNTDTENSAENNDETNGILLLQVLYTIDIEQWKAI